MEAAYRQERKFNIGLLSGETSDWITETWKTFISFGVTVSERIIVLRISTCL